MQDGIEEDSCSEESTDDNSDCESDTQNFEIQDSDNGQLPLVLRQVSKKIVGF